MDFFFAAFARAPIGIAAITANVRSTCHLRALRLSLRYKGTMGIGIDAPMGVGDDRMYLDFPQRSADSVIHRRLGSDVDETVQRAR